MAGSAQVATPSSASTSRSLQRTERRNLILAATGRILTTDGLAAVTHRAVAREAEVPLAATTYYFASKEELIAEALAILVEDEIASLAARAAELGAAISSPSDSAAAVAEVLVGDPQSTAALLAKLEVYLDAARHPGLRAAASHWRQAFTTLAESSLRLAGAREPERLAPLLVAGIDGILVHELSHGIGDDSAARIRPRLEGLFTIILAAD
jgi:DNA-binding transcriptional regulator YbjK